MRQYRALIAVSAPYILGASLLFFIATQVFTGLVQSQIPGITCGLGNNTTIRDAHSMIPYALTALVFAHSARAALVANTTRRGAWGSGLRLAVIMLAWLGSGYVVNRGEAGYWGGNLITAMIVDQAIDHILGPLIGLLSATPYEVSQWLLESGITGNVAFDTSVVDAWLSSIHFLLGLAVVLPIMAHLKTTHREPSAAMYARGGELTPKSPLLGVVEAKDLAAVMLAVVFWLYFAIACAHSLHVGNNGIYINPARAPDEIITEIYLAPMYVMLRILSVDHAFLFMVVVGVVISETTTAGFQRFSIVLFGLVWTFLIVWACVGFPNIGWRGW